MKKFIIQEELLNVALHAIRFSSAPVNQPNALFDLMEMLRHLPEYKEETKQEENK